MAGRWLSPAKFRYGDILPQGRPGRKAHGPSICTRFRGVRTPAAPARHTKQLAHRCLGHMPTERVDAAKAANCSALASGRFRLGVFFRTSIACRHSPLRQRCSGVHRSRMHAAEKTSESGVGQRPASVTMRTAGMLRNRTGGPPAGAAGLCHEETSPGRRRSQQFRGVADHHERTGKFKPAISRRSGSRNQKRRGVPGP
jgi:hypothetical protein